MIIAFVIMVIVIGLALPGRTAKEKLVVLKEVKLRSVRLTKPFMIHEL